MAETPAPFPAFHSRRSLAGTPEAPQAGPAPLRLEPNRGDTRLLDGLGAEYAAHHGLLPLGRRGAVTLVAAESAEVFAGHRSLLEARLGPVAFVLASRERKIPATEARAELLDEAARKVVGRKLGMADARLRELLHLLQDDEPAGGQAARVM